jgi:hypothetical protein
LQHQKKEKKKRFESRQERKTRTPRIRQIQNPHQRKKKPRKKDLQGNFKNLRLVLVVVLLQTSSG